MLGELSLDGSIQPVTGTLPAALNAAAQKRRIICPSANGPEAGWAGELNGHVQAVLTQAMERQKLSARGFHKILRVARTIADLARSEQIDPTHVLEALFYRRYFLFGAVDG